jgi:2-dehydro-3-deoxy-D-pentonate aldolase
LFPKLFVDLYEASVIRDFDKIAVLRNKVMRLYNTIYSVGKSSSKFTKGINCALSVLGICNDYVAFPLRRFEGDDRQKIEQYMTEMNEILRE